MGDQCILPLEDGAQIDVEVIFVGVGDDRGLAGTKCFGQSVCGDLAWSDGYGYGWDVRARHSATTRGGGGLADGDFRLSDSSERLYYRISSYLWNQCYSAGATGYLCPK